MSICCSLNVVYIWWFAGFLYRVLFFRSCPVLFCRFKGIELVVTYYGWRVRVPCPVFTEVIPLCQCYYFHRFFNIVMIHDQYTITNTSVMAKRKADNKIAHCRNISKNEEKWVVLTFHLTIPFFFGAVLFLIQIILLVWIS